VFDTPLFHRVAGPQTHGLVSLAVAHDGARAILIQHDASEDEVGRGSWLTRRLSENGRRWRIRRAAPAGRKKRPIACSCQKLQGLRLERIAQRGRLALELRMGCLRNERPRDEQAEKGRQSMEPS